MTELPTAVRRVVIDDPLGFHPHIAEKFARLAKSFRSDIVVIGNDMRVDGKGIIGMMALAAGCVTTLDIGAIGLDADDAVTALADLLAAGFDDTEDNGGDGTGG